MENISKGFATEAEYNMYNGLNWMFLKTVKEAIKMFDDTKNYTPQEVDLVAQRVLNAITPASASVLKYLYEHNSIIRDGGDQYD